VKYQEYDDSVVIEGLDSFDIEETLDSGQCFRYAKHGEACFSVVAHGCVLYIEQKDGLTRLYPCTAKAYEGFWCEYFDMNRDYSAIKASLAKDDSVMEEAISLAPGIRIVKQDTWECLVTFIISANNRIPMIKQVVKNISERFGTLIDGQSEYAFPMSNRLSEATLEELADCKAGFRAKYIMDAARRVNGGQLSLDIIRSLPSDELRRALMEVNGVGVKVADCVMLLSFARGDVFPIDVWIRRIMQEAYFCGREVPLPELQAFARDKWGSHAGYANQYLFNFARFNKIGAKAKTAMS